LQLPLELEMTLKAKPTSETLIKRFSGDERAASSIEYALIAMIAGVGYVASLTPVQQQLSSIFSTVATAFQVALN